MTGPLDLSPRDAIEAYGVLFWQNRIGRFKGRTWADHQGEARSVADTLRCCERELNESRTGHTVGLEAALRDMARLKEILE